MIVHDTSALRIRGSGPGATAARVTAVLGVEPTFFGEQGDRSYSSRTQPFTDGGVRQTSLWVLQMSDEDEESAPFVASMDALLDLVEPVADRLALLADDYEVELDWLGGSEGSQAAFSIPARLLRRIADLGLDLALEVISSD